VAFGGKTLFMADENDSNFAGWFELGSPDTLLQVIGGAQRQDLAVFSAPAKGGVLEGTLDLAAIFGSLPAVVYVAAAPYATVDGGKIYSPAQTPVTRDGNGNIEANEILKVSIPSLKVLP